MLSTYNKELRTQVLFLILRRVTSNQKLNIATISELELINPVFQPLRRFKLFSPSLGVINYFQPYISMPTDTELQDFLILFRYLNINCSTLLPSLVQPIQIFTVHLRHCINRGTSYSILIRLVRMEFQRTFFSYFHLINIFIHHIFYFTSFLYSLFGFDVLSYLIFILKMFLCMQSSFYY